MHRVAVVGAAGYSGAELVAILLSHPAVELAGLFGSERRGAGSDAERFDSLHPRFRGATELRVEAADPAAILAQRPAAVFLATPHEASEALAPRLLEEGVVVFDLSAAFRLRDAAAYPAHYGFSHGHPELLKSAAYGLPELHAEAIADATLIACPGCYPTSVILPMRPLAESGVLAADEPIIVDAASGVSGAGRTAAVKSLFCEVSFQPYGVLSHRHQPEMEQETGRPILFTPHLLPLDRGILSTIHARLAPGASIDDARACLEERYAGQPFVRILPRGQWPSIAGVERTNLCDIALGCDRSGRHLVVASAIDNLLKGAAGQAVQCFNVRFGLPQQTALGPEWAARKGVAAWMDR